MRWRPSLGARWTLLFTAVMVLTASVPLGYAWFGVEYQLRAEQERSLRDHVAELASEIERSPDDLDAPLEIVAAQLGATQADERPSVAVIDDDGRVLAARGALASNAFVLPPAWRSDRDASRAFELDLGDRYPYRVMFARHGNRALAVAVYTRPLARSVDEFRDFVEIAAPLAFAVTALAGLWLARRSLRPLAEMTEAMHRVTARQLDARIPVSGSGDELDRLAQVVNAMVDRLQAALETTRDFSARAAHQLRTPLSHLRTRIELSLAEPDLAAGTAQTLQAALDDVVELSDLVESLLRLARAEGGPTSASLRTLDLQDIARDVISLFGPLAAERGLHIEPRLQTAAVRGDPSLLRQMIGNILENAVRHGNAGGDITVSISADAGFAEARVEDDGPGIPPDEIDHVFERFFRGREGRSTAGTGLGLAIAREVAQSHGGTIVARSTPGLGTTIACRLPLAQEKALALAEARPPELRNEPPT